MRPRQFCRCRVALLCISTGMLIGTVGCLLVGNPTEGQMSPEPKGPTQPWSSGPEVDGHRRRRALLGLHNHEDNLFLSRAQMVANLTSKGKDCWVCGLSPVKVGAGFPLVGVPIGVNFTIALAGKIPFNTMTNNVKVYNQPNIFCYVRPDNVSLPPISVARVVTAPWCIRGYGDHYLGEFKCNCTMHINGSNACNLKVIQENGQVDKEPFTIWFDKHRTTLRGAPNGTYWLCGKTAYYNLPLNWGGTCTVGFVVTAMRTVPNNDKNLKALFRDYRPPGMRRDKRSLADITHTQAPASRFFDGFFPGYGVAGALDQIRDISRHVEKFGNATRNALEQLNRELKELAELTLQNREALDYLLAAQGGTCAIIGDECCTFVPGRSSNVTDLAEYIATVAKNNSPQLEWTLTTWLESLFGSWGSQIAQWAAACVFCLVCIIVLLTCCKAI
ncbi:endogenous retrovirus group 3 member 1 Env polyprotein [Salmo salar]|uniref:Endogenous retrovirus group 3 member 1 Env polyprotein-like n=1 Tax=Salmo salar TaxID=8030 RepID=A0A1S3L3X9_SALSA|nr:endogenous retrovirus group 3 member 1 Env polyprotein-like [Salmo salar]XP_013985638.1 endogenous retrovirus group 3 member 1 Env polyprotein-like [Salmo salar]XP_013985640.1 endogenous retrovirus group 3 member 1 Env polyprotein-like [Salmo salar]XP_045546621.1 endogenous retrovirus group 3 member 1 Env polyprotein-like [Salmo salar]|eukprot:XP_013985637.1 PREDICTED: endogenous retrovirus group 3 member 1 Env polyprotein-like [Salmo salar]